MNPLPVLRTFRFDKDLMGVTFGMNAVVVGGAGTTLERGTKCEVALKTSDLRAEVISRQSPAE